ncbi:CPBP family intramembrane glutamic endopeptidase [uncultured Nocardioides sp.]|uniref:CPBP family intramembrane glutamic endopeptidase n=1 Tax=uncultured Nocardioides sp. TaxID=198441 RepID=UPI00261FB907|nr:CPBP family intramembrane glutamic endopeptidase [uncultured Nocardioides sp.]
MTTARRQQVVTAVFAVVGTVLLGSLLRLTPGGTSFYVVTLALALVWAIGAFAAGPVHLGRQGWFTIRPSEPARRPDETRTDAGPRDRFVGPRPFLVPLGIGLGLAGVFIVGGLIVREIPFLYEAVTAVLAFAAAGTGPLLLFITVVNGLGEELFFRGALYDAVRGRKVLITTVVYALATLLTGNVMLAFAAIVLGAITGQQRRVTGGIMAPMITHVTWSVSMLYALPLLFPV